MALMKCPECGEMVSSSAKRCSSCGYKIKKSPWRTIIFYILMILCGLFLLNLLSAIGLSFFN